MPRPRRLDDFDYLGCHLYFLTFCALDRQRVFTSDEIVRLAPDQILLTASEQEMEILVYCFMPDHLHLLIEGKSDSANLKDFAKLAKQRSGWHYAQAHGKRLWQEGYYEHVLRGQEYPPQVICYIVENPVRAGLVTAPGEYPFWGSEKYTREEILEFAEASRRV
jgi:putative transposase